MFKELTYLVKYLMVKANINLKQINHMPTLIDYCYDISRLSDPNKIKTIIDVGAHVGEVSTKFHRFFPQAQIYAFEPVHATYEQGLTNTSKLDKIEYINCALGSEAGTVNIPLHGSANLNSLVQGLNDREAVAFEEIKVERLENFASQRNIDWIDLLKTDTEGFDLQVLQGAGDLIKSQQIGFIVSEVGFSRLEKRFSYFSQILDYLDQNGYLFLGLYDLSSLGWLYCWNSLGSNALFISRKLLD